MHTLFQSVSQQPVNRSVSLPACQPASLPACPPACLPVSQSVSQPDVPNNRIALHGVSEIDGARVQASHPPRPHARSDLGWCRECGDCHMLLCCPTGSPAMCVRGHMRARNGLTHLMNRFHCQDMLCNSPLLLLLPRSSQLYVGRNDLSRPAGMNFCLSLGPGSSWSVGLRTPPLLSSPPALLPAACRRPPLRQCNLDWFISAHSGECSVRLSRRYYASWSPSYRL